MLISDAYRAQNRTLHENAQYGAKGHIWSEIVARLIDTVPARTVLDYGCGKGTLGEALRDKMRIAEYDPAIPQKSAPPEKADLVVCTDVLEHIEPDNLDDVLDDLERLTERAAFLNVATVPAKKTLPDGRNAHLIIEPYAWWLPRLYCRWTLMAFQNLNSQFYVICRKK